MHYRPTTMGFDPKNERSFTRPPRNSYDIRWLNRGWVLEDINRVLLDPHVVLRVGARTVQPGAQGLLHFIGNAGF